MSGGYDDGYKGCPCFWGTTPGSLVLHLSKICSLAGLRVLDLGCGEGKNANYFAAQGARVVDAVEISPFALANARRTFPENRSIEWIQADVASWRPSKTYDIVAMYGLLHCLPDAADISTVIGVAQRATAPGGFNVVCSFNSRFQELQAHPGFMPTLMPHSAFAEAYADWNMILLTDADLVESHPHNNIQHTHSMTRLIARKTL